jgi:hypothetical protein
MLLNARRIYAAGTEKPIILLAIEDITKQKQLEAQIREYTEKLTTEVAERTKELSKRIDELERLNKVMIGRELKMINLKEELVKLKKTH